MIPLNFFTIQTPALLFPTVSLLMIAYTNRFLGINTVIRKLHDDMEKDEENHNFYYSQIQSLSKRTKLIINAQKTGMLSMILCVFSMITIFISLLTSVVIFTVALVLTLISLLMIFRELALSREVLEYILEDCMKIHERRLKK